LYRKKLKLNIMNMKQMFLMAALTVGAGGNAVAQRNTTTDGVPMVTLNNGVKMPQFGLGVYSLKEGDETYNSVLTALKIGYRHIDTAHAYQNERSVGRAIKDSGISRDSIWITSKLWPNEYGAAVTQDAIKKMCKRLGVDYIDMVYLHQPVGDFIGGWKELEKAQKAGIIKAIGISDFDVNDSIFNSLVENVEVIPQVLQLECHPYAQRKHWQEMCKKHNIQIESWFPLGGRDSQGEILRDPVINEIAKTHGKSAAQVIIRWHIQMGFSVVPGSSNPKHIKDNISIFDFSLSDYEMVRIAALDKEKRYFNMPYEEQKRMFGGFKLWD
jgi:diketogulonate reductase-like aldo/keto reductase